MYIYNITLPRLPAGYIVIPLLFDLQCLEYVFNH